MYIYASRPSPCGSPGKLAPLSIDPAPYTRNNTTKQAPAVLLLRIGRNWAYQHARSRRLQYITLILQAIPAHACRRSSIRTLFRQTFKQSFAQTETAGCFEANNNVTGFALLFFLFSFASSTTPGNLKGDYLSTMPPAATLQPKLTTSPTDSTTCLETDNSTICCPTDTTCVKKQDINSVSGWGCCNAAAAGATCPLLLSNEKCALQGWVVCGGVDGELKSATCCEKVEICREIGRGRLDCAAEAM